MFFLFECFSKNENYKYGYFIQKFYKITFWNIIKLQLYLFFKKIIKYIKDNIS